MGLLAQPSNNSAGSVQSQVLLRLFEAYEDSREFHQDIWQFALQLPALRAENIPDRSLRRLVAQGLVAHARETTTGNARRRTMRQLAHFQFSDQSCFVLTARGVALASAQTKKAAPAPEGGPPSRPQADPLELLAPSFVRADDGCRKLQLGDAVVKRFVAPARNQELVLQAFQEENWTRHILDPIPPQPGLDSKLRLHNAIARLNSGQLEPLLRFHGDGTGKAIYWKARASDGYRPNTGRI